MAKRKRKRYKEKRTYEDRRDYQRDYQRRWKRKNREDAVKVAGDCCRICASGVDLQFHHQNPEKKFSHRIWSWSKERRDAELKKCVLYCAYHHKKWHNVYNRLKNREPVTFKEVALYSLQTFVGQAALTL